MSYNNNYIKNNYNRNNIRYARPRPHKNYDIPIKTDYSKLPYPSVKIIPCGNFPLSLSFTEFYTDIKKYNRSPIPSDCSHNYSYSDYRRNYNIW
jgi:hypothetical protein